MNVRRGSIGSRRHCKRASFIWSATIDCNASASQTQILPRQRTRRRPL